MGLVSWFGKILRRQAIVEELGHEENTRTGELDDKSKGVYEESRSRGVQVKYGIKVTLRMKIPKLRLHLPRWEAGGTIAKFDLKHRINL